MGFLDRILGREARAEVITADDHLLSLLKKTEITPETATEIPAVSACIGFIASMIAGLPVKLYREDKSRNRTEEIKDDFRLKLLNDETGDLLDPFQMKQAVVADYFLYGSGFIYPEMYGNDVLSLRYIRNTAISSYYSSADPVFKMGEYVLSNGMRLRDDEVIRLLHDTRDGLKGESIILQHQQILSTIYREIVYEKLLVSSGGNKKGFLTSENKLSAEMLSDLRQKWQDMYANTGNTMMILNKGISFHESSNTSVEMQLSENKIRNNELVCQIFGLSPEVISGRAGEEALASAVKGAVVPVIMAFEAALDRGLLLPSERDLMYFTFDTTELLKGDILKRYQAYKTGLECNVLQIDEARYKEDLPPLGLNWIKLGLQDVLYDPKTKTIYTPNMNQSMQMSENKVNFGNDEVDNSGQSGIMEERAGHSNVQWTKGEHGYFTGSVGSGGGGSGGGSGGGASESGISGKHESANAQNSVDLEYLKSEEYKNKFKGITGNTKVDEQLYQQSKAILTHRNGTDKEDLCLIDSQTGKIVGRQSNSKIDFGVEYNSSIENAIKKNPRGTLISIHNHPTNNPPTGSDFVSNGSNGYKLGIAVTHNGKVFTYKAGEKPFSATTFGKQVDKYRGFGYTEYDAIINVLNDFSVEYGIEWSER